MILEAKWRRWCVFAYVEEAGIERRGEPDARWHESFLLMGTRGFAEGSAGF